jgi:hypothetical protein
LPKHVCSGLCTHPPQRRRFRLGCAPQAANQLQLIKLGFENATLFPTYEGAVRSVFDYDWARIGPAF